MTWYRAVDYCKDLDAYLAEVLNDETQALLATEASLLPPTNWWIGASDEENVSKDIWQYFVLKIVLTYCKKKISID